MNKYIRHILLIILSLGLTLTACRTDGDDLGGESDVRTFSIGVGSRAVSEAATNELINTWWVAFVRSDGTIQAFADGNLGSEAVERDYFELSLPADTYDVVAFANRIPQPAGTDSYTFTIGTEELTFTKGEQSPVRMGDKRLFDDPAPEKWADDAALPMSGLHQVVVTGRQNERIAVEVVRQVAKFDITITNEGKRPVTLHSYWVEGLKAKANYYFPEYKALGTLPVLPNALDTADVHRPGFTLTATGERHRDVFYTLESIAQKQPHKVYTLYLDVSRPAVPENDLGETRDTISALLTDIAWVTRNDHVVVPVSLSDYIIKVNAEFYPPIGGYPAIVTEVSYGNYFITFGSIGDFVITPHIRKAEAGSPDLQPGQLDVELTYENLDGVDIFSVPPTVDPYTGEFRGSIGSVPGAARVYLSFTIPPVEPGDKELTVTRKIIIRRVA